MSSQERIQLFSNEDSETDSIQEQIPVLYLWFGETVPEDYLISLSEMNYPVVFLKNPKIERNFSRQLMDIQKADYYRLWYLYEHGGIYSDFDNTINYKCLLKLLSPYKNQNELIFMTDGRHTRQKTQQITNNLIYAPRPKLPILKKMLDYIDETKQKVWQFAGIKFTGHFQEPIEMNMSKCVYHSYDWSWYKASNEVLGLNAQPHPHYARKLIKKSQILLQKDRIQEELKEYKSQLSILSADLRRISYDNIQLKNQMLEVHDKILTICPQASKVLNNYEDCLSNPTNGHGRNTEEDQGLNCQQQLKLWDKVSEISQQNKKLRLENKVLKWEIYGSIGLIVMVLVLCFFFLRRKKVNESKKVDLVEKQTFLEH